MEVCFVIRTFPLGKFSQKSGSLRASSPGSLRLDGVRPSVTLLSNKGYFYLLEFASKASNRHIAGFDDGLEW